MWPNVVLAFTACTLVLGGCAADLCDSACEAEGAYGDIGSTTSSIVSDNALAANGLGDNGISLNGISLNGISLNGISLNGISLNGISLNGISLNGISLNGISLNGISLNGISLNGISLNGISLNGISLNGISLNGISLNGISLNGTNSADFKTTLGHVVACALPQGSCVNATDLDGSSLSYCGDDGIDPGWSSGTPDLTKSGAMGQCVLARGQAASNTVSHTPVHLPAFKQLMSYLTSCALPSGSSISITDENNQSVTYHGQLGLAPEWATGAISAGSEERVSACLLARVNAYGVSVQVSLRLPGYLTADSDEREDYPVFEAAFFGNVFESGGKAYGCVGSGYTFASAHAPSRTQRVCADDSADCQLVSVGRCRDVCGTKTKKYGWQDCTAGGQTYSDTISVYLADPDVDDRNEVCGANGSCSYFFESGHDVVIDCESSASCAATCTSGAVCTIDGSDATSFSPGAASGGFAEIDCHGAEDCSANCYWGGVCEVDCKDADDCSQVQCTGGGSCLIDCTGAVDCGFGACDGTVTQCPGDILVCGRACPAPPTN